MLKLAFSIELTWLLVDMVSGLFQHNDVAFAGGQSIGALFRAGVLVVLAWILIQHADPRTQAIVTALPVAGVWLLVQATYWNMPGREATGNAQFLMKCLLAILMYGTLKAQLRLGVLSLRQVRWVVAINALVLLGNIALSALGLGFAQYGLSSNGELVGGKGFFYGGNEVAGTIVCVFALLLILFHPWLVRHAALLTLLILGFMLASVSAATKTSMLGVLILTAYALVYVIPTRSAWRALFIGVAAAAASSPLWLPLLDRVVDRWSFFLDVSSDLLSFATSGRSERIGDFAAWIEQQASIGEILLGRGYLGDSTTVSFENDLLDLLYCYGLLGCVPFAVMAGQALSAFRRREPWQPDPFARLAGACLFLLLAISVAAGHVMYAAMQAPFIALLALTPALVQMPELRPASAQDGNVH